MIVYPVDMRYKSSVSKQGDGKILLWIHLNSSGHNVDELDLDIVSESYTIMTVSGAVDVLHAATGSVINFPLGSGLQLTLGVFLVPSAALSI